MPLNNKHMKNDQEMRLARKSDRNMQNRFECGRSAVAVERSMALDARVSSDIFPALG